MATKIDTVSARRDLKSQHAPYWQKLGVGCHVGFRKITPESTGSWIARYREDSGKYQLHSLGSLETVTGSDRYTEAVKRANAWFDHRGRGGSNEALTVEQACQRYVQQSRDEMEVLFHFLAERYERKTVVITSNLVFSQWDRIFKDPMTTMAAVDRLVHHSTILDFSGESVRGEKAAEDAAKQRSR